MTQIRVMSAIADRTNLTLYAEDGQTYVIKMGDPRVTTLLDTILPIIARSEIAVVNLEDFSVYAEFTRKSNGLVKFFKVAKQKLADFFGSAPVVVNLPETEEPKEEAKPVVKDHAGIIAAAVPVTTDEDIAPHETVIAVVEDKVIPEVEKIKNQIVHSSKTNTVGMENFLRRLSGMIDKRDHNVQDVLKFVERGDLPIADDGCIIAYKRLYSTKEQGVFVDPHTRRVTQKVGSFVCVDESLVDRNRRNECSNGLHIGRRAYMGSFQGDIMVLAKVAPEDVIAVPHNDPNKVRVCGYHILDVIPSAAAEKINTNKPMTSIPEAQELLARAIAGKHVGKLEEVRITQQKGNGLVITPLNADGSRKISKIIVTEEEKSAAKAFDDGAGAIATKVEPKEINKKLAEEEAKASAEAVKAVEQVLGPKEKTGALKDAENMFNNMMDASLSVLSRKTAASDLLSLKKRLKKGWGKLDLPENTGDTINSVMELPEEKVSKPQTKAAPAKQAKAATKDEAKVTQPGIIVPAVDAPAREWARYHFDTANWELLVALKKSKKVGWDRLGFSGSEIETILEKTK